MAASASLTSSATEQELTMTVKWSGKEYAVRVCGDDSVAGLKRHICELTNVLPKRQKLIYPKISNKLADDSAFLSQLPLKFSLKKTMIGTVENDIIVNQMDSPEIVDDFEHGQDEAVDIEDVEVNKQKLRRRIDQYEIEVKNPCRPGKKLLVLDIDYKLNDHPSTAETPPELMSSGFMLNNDLIRFAQPSWLIFYWSKLEWGFI